MPVTLLSSKISVCTASTVMIGPPDFSTTRFPDLKTVIGRSAVNDFVSATHGKQSFRVEVAAPAPKQSKKAKRKSIGRAIIEAKRRHHVGVMQLILAHHPDSQQAVVLRYPMPADAGGVPSRRSGGHLGARTAIWD